MNGFQQLPISRKTSILNAWRGSEYDFVLLSGLIGLQQQGKNKISCGPF